MTFDVVMTTTSTNLFYLYLLGFGAEDGDLLYVSVVDVNVDLLLSTKASVDVSALQDEVLRSSKVKSGKILDFDDHTENEEFVLSDGYAVVPDVLSDVLGNEFITGKADADGADDADVNPSRARDYVDHVSSDVECEYDSSKNGDQLSATENTSSSVIASAACVSLSVSPNSESCTVENGDAAHHTVASRSTSTKSIAL